MDSFHPVHGGTASVGCHCCAQVTLWSNEDKLREILYLAFGCHVGYGISY